MSCLTPGRQCWLGLLTALLLGAMLLKHFWSQPELDWDQNWIDLERVQVVALGPAHWSWATVGRSGGGQCGPALGAADPSTFEG